MDIQSPVEDQPGIALDPAVIRQWIAAQQARLDAGQPLSSQGIPPGYKIDNGKIVDKNAWDTWGRGAALTVGGGLAAGFGAAALNGAFAAPASAASSTSSSAVPLAAGPGAISAPAASPVVGAVSDLGPLNAAILPGASGVPGALPATALATAPATSTAAMAPVAATSASGAVPVAAKGAMDPLTFASFMSSPGGAATINGLGGMFSAIGQSQSSEAQRLQDAIINAAAIKNNQSVADRTNANSAAQPLGYANSYAMGNAAKQQLYGQVFDPKALEANLGKDATLAALMQNGQQQAGINPDQPQMDFSTFGGFDANKATAANAKVASYQDSRQRQQQSQRSQIDGLYNSSFNGDKPNPLQSAIIGTGYNAPYTNPTGRPAQPEYNY